MSNGSQPLGTTPLGGAGLESTAQKISLIFTFIKKISLNFIFVKKVSI